MIITLRGRFLDSPKVLFGRLGYHPEPGYHGEEAYARRVGRLPYPRFHLYIHHASPAELRCRLHLDQKRPSYPGSPSHAAEYSGPLVEAEARRIRSVLKV